MAENTALAALFLSEGAFFLVLLFLALIRDYRGHGQAQNEEE